MVLAGSLDWSEGALLVGDDVATFPVGWLLTTGFDDRHYFILFTTRWRWALSRHSHPDRIGGTCTRYNNSRRTHTAAAVGALTSNFLLLGRLGGSSVYISRLVVRGTHSQYIIDMCDDRYVLLFQMFDMNWSVGGWRFKSTRYKFRTWTHLHRRTPRILIIVYGQISIHHVSSAPNVRERVSLPEEVSEWVSLPEDGKWRNTHKHLPIII